MNKCTESQKKSVHKCPIWVKSHYQQVGRATLQANLCNHQRWRFLLEVSVISVCPLWHTKQQYIEIRSGSFRHIFWRSFRVWFWRPIFWCLLLDRIFGFGKQRSILERHLAGGQALKFSAKHAIHLCFYTMTIMFNDCLSCSTSASTCFNLILFSILQMQHHRLHRINMD